jgi:hypothetical protein
MLEPVRLVVHLVHVDAERLREIELEQAVVPDHLERDALALGRQGHPPVRRVRDQVERRELLHHRARRRGRDAHLAGKARRRHLAAGAREVVDAAQVVLDRVAQHRPRHAASVLAVVARRRAAAGSVGGPWTSASATARTPMTRSCTGR